MDKEEIARRVGWALLSETVDQRPAEIKNLLVRHGANPGSSDEDLIYQIIQKSNERGLFFDNELAKEINEAGYFGIEQAISAGLKIRGDQMKATIQTIKEMINKKKAAGGGDGDSAVDKVKLKDRLKNLFGGKDKKNTVEDLAKSKDAKDIAGATDKDDKDPDPEEKKKILGMTIPVFVGLVSLFVIIVIVIIVLVVKNNKKKALAAKKTG